MADAARGPDRVSAGRVVRDGGGIEHHDVRVGAWLQKAFAGESRIAGR